MSNGESATGWRSATPWCSQYDSTYFVAPTRKSWYDSRSVASGSSRSENQFVSSCV